MERMTSKPNIERVDTLISIGSVVEVRYIEDEFEDDTEIVQIVGMHNEGFTGGADQTASIGTPLVQAVLGKQAGERLTFTGPGGAGIVIEIVSVRS